ncbi:hypothetical protein [Sphingobacterium sp. N143]|uniref:hypothetical protein n=1 Tax=Sphingobacterium sp. N143 TaxID=2746727 RepID=UPI002575B04A|nr:hypothetical protein [Sphingobacterium sp. N143]
MKTDERNIISTLAQLLVNGAGPVEFRTTLTSLLNTSTLLRPGFLVLADQWLNADYTAAFPHEKLWADFKSAVESNPDLGFVIIEGRQIGDIPGFYAEINRVYMADEDWQVGNLDGFNDLLYGGFGKLKDVKQQGIIWKDIAHSRKSLGVETTLAYYQDKLQSGSPFNHAHFQQQLEELQAGRGQTYFDIVTEIIQSHPEIIWIY